MSKKAHYGIDWLKSKLRRHGDISIDSEADLSGWQESDWEKIAGRCHTSHDWCELLKLHPESSSIPMAAAEENFREMIFNDAMARKK